MHCSAFQHGSIGNMSQSARLESLDKFRKVSAMCIALLSDGRIGNMSKSA